MPRSRTERIALITAALLAVVVLAFGVVMVAGGATTTPTPPPAASAPAPAATATASVPATSAKVASTTVPGATGAYALDFTLPTYGKSGCLVCHGDPNLVVSKGDANVSFWVDEEAYSRSAHGKQICTACHIDYGYKAPHGSAGQDWREVAKQSCKNCKQHQTQYQEWTQSSHMPRPSGGKPDPKAASKPACGDCHGGHDIPAKDDTVGKQRVRTEAQRVCGRDGCHADYWSNYNDYYHGAAYKTGAVDAPPCWDCHGTHAILASTNRFSPTNEANYGEDTSCGRCHEGAGAAYSGYVKMIHGRDKAKQDNPIYRFLGSITGR